MTDNRISDLLNVDDVKLSKYRMWEQASAAAVPVASTSKPFSFQMSLFNLAVGCAIVYLLFTAGQNLKERTEVKKKEKEDDKDNASSFY
jgi:hypothetical protein